MSVLALLIYTWVVMIDEYLLEQHWGCSICAREVLFNMQLPQSNLLVNFVTMIESFLLLKDI